MVDPRFSKLTALDPNDDKTPVLGDLFADAKLSDGTHVKTGLHILKNETLTKSIADWCEIPGLRESDVVADDRSACHASVAHLTRMGNRRTPF